MDNDFVNNSGLGKNTEVNELISKNFNWGACLLTWIWGLFNKTYITLIFLPICLLPSVVAIIMLGILSIYFGINGNTWAWQNKRWKSVKHFHSVQKKWAISASFLIAIGVIVCILFPLAFKYDMYRYTHPKGDLKEVYSQILTCKEKAKIAMEKINQSNVLCGKTSKELTQCFIPYFNVKSSKEIAFILEDFSVWSFFGVDASKYSKGPIIDNGYNYILIDVNGEASPNQRGIDIITIPLITDTDGKYLVDENIKKTTHLILIDK